MSVTNIRGSENSQLFYQVEQLLDIKSYPFYHGPLDGVSCEELLRWKPNGTYVVRDGEKPNLFYLSWVTDSTQCHFAHVPFSLTQGEWTHKNMHVSVSLNLATLVSKMIRLPNEQCVPLNKV